MSDAMPNTQSTNDDNAAAATPAAIESKQESTVENHTGSHVETIERTMMDDAEKKEAIPGKTERKEDNNNNAFNKKNEANTNAAADTESNKTDKVPEEVVPAVESPKANDEETNEECTEALVTGSLAENKAVLCEIMKTMFEEHFTALNKKLDMLLEQGCAELSPTNEPMHDGFESEKEAAASPTSETTVKVGDTVNYLSNSSMGKVKRINLAEVEWDNKGKAKYEDMNKLTVYDPNAKRPRRSVFPDGASSKKQKN